MTFAEFSPADAVRRCQDVFAHAWMVRTFVKHSSEVEEFPELMQVARTVFDVSRSLESRVDDPPAYFHQLRKKIRRLREAAAQFRHDAPLASDHTNFRQAVVSMDACVASLEQILAAAVASSSSGEPPRGNPIPTLDTSDASPDDAP